MLDHSYAGTPGLRARVPGLSLALCLHLYSDWLTFISLGLLAYVPELPVGTVRAPFSECAFSWLTCRSKAHTPHPLAYVPGIWLRSIYIFLVVKTAALHSGAYWLFVAQALVMSPKRYPSGFPIGLNYDFTVRLPPPANPRSRSPLRACRSVTGGCPSVLPARMEADRSGGACTATAGNGIRADAPVVRHSSAGSREVALAALAFTQSDALDSLRQDYVANSAKASVASLLRTWEAFSEQAFPSKQPWPLCPVKLEVIATGFKAGGYRSFQNYLSRAKQRHVELGFPWTDLLEL
eukprot:6490688-Amphidinium_carterae.1